MDLIIRVFAARNAFRRSMVWMKNVENYVEETETYILNDEHVHQEIVDEGG